jgi:hypothetical protein
MLTPLKAFLPLISNRLIRISELKIKIKKIQQTIKKEN